jgi:hypothetical protein
VRLMRGRPRVYYKYCNHFFSLRFIIIMSLLGKAAIALSAFGTVASVAAGEGMLGGICAVNVVLCCLEEFGEATANLTVPGKVKPKIPSAKATPAPSARLG